MTGPYHHPGGWRETALAQRVASLERRFRALALYATILTLLLVVGCLAAFQAESGEARVIRARGIVIVDAAGRDRILIGAPVPQSSARVRTDLERVARVWGTRFPERYMQYYRNYRHAVHGMIVLDENGFDRLVIGDSVPDPNIGRRVGSSTGVLVNNDEGFERTGYGLLNVEGTYRVVLGLDSKRGQEGLALVLDDAGRVGMDVRDGANHAWIGTLSGQNGQTNFGLTIGAGDDTTHRLTVRPR